MEATIAGRHMEKSTDKKVEQGLQRGYLSFWNPGRYNTGNIDNID